MGCENPLEKGMTTHSGILAYGQRSLVGYSPWGHKQLDTIEWQTLSLLSVSSVAQSCPTLCDSIDWSKPGLPVHHQLPEFTQTHVHWVGDAIQPSHPLSFPSPTFSLSQHQSLFQWVSSSNQEVKVLEFQLQHQSFQWIFKSWFPLGLTGLISLLIQETLKSLRQHHSSKTSILWHSAFFMVQLSHPYMTTGETIALTRQTCVSQVMSLLFNTLSRCVIAFLGASVF